MNFKCNMRNLLSQSPVSVNEVLDLFEDYVATIGAPLTKAVNMINDELDYHQGDIFDHIVGVVDDADSMAKRLNAIRAARNTGTDVTVTVTYDTALRTVKAAETVSDLLAHTEEMLELLQNLIADGDGDRAVSIVALAQRALMGAAEQEGASLSILAHKLREASQSSQMTKEQAA